MHILLYITTSVLISIIVVLWLILDILKNIYSVICDDKISVDNYEKTKDSKQGPQLVEFPASKKDNTLWAYGYWTGPNNSCLCVKNNLSTLKECQKNLSHIKKSPIEAMEVFIKNQINEEL